MPDSARHTAFLVLRHLSSNRHTLDTVLDKTITAAKITSRRDRHFISALAHGTLRWQGRLDWILDQVSSRPVQKINPDVRHILRLGLFQILFMDRVPVSAAVNTSVDLARTRVGPKVTGFVNAVLRNAIRHQDTLSFPDPSREPIASIAAELSFPVWMIKRWVTQMGYEETAAMCRATNEIAPLTLRTNLLQNNRQELMARLQAAKENPVPTPCSSLGIRLGRTHHSIPELPGFGDGAFQVQDEAAQLVTFILDPQPGEKILDACAGLGGKTGHIAQKMKNTGKITAVDFQSEKLTRLHREMRRLGVTIVSSRTADLNKPSAVSSLGSFDRILLDAPCSGMGVLRRHPDAKWRHTARTLSKMAERQRRMLRHLSRSVEPGGILVYAVCSTEPEENKDVIDHFLHHHPNFKLTPASSLLPKAARHITDSDGFFRSFVHRHGMDGFFIARLQKSHAAES
ncbi:MAG: 16S rRNA (cytosine(967)-C(5))-methyltransferase RsmB [Deltaproteobacteria bacterium]|nr:MAG: 16S rRNA (cytosine(967)-C(5))-methyltransferase RsmB [Deltaproteobacteria bacterium]